MRRQYERCVKKKKARKKTEIRLKIHDALDVARMYVAYASKIIQVALTCIHTKRGNREMYSVIYPRNTLFGYLLTRKNYPAKKEAAHAPSYV